MTPCQQLFVVAAAGRAGIAGRLFFFLFPDVSPDKGGRILMKLKSMLAVPFVLVLLVAGYVFLYRPERVTEVKPEYAFNSIVPVTGHVLIDSAEKEKALLAEFEEAKKKQKRPEDSYVE